MMAVDPWDLVCALITVRQYEGKVKAPVAFGLAVTVLVDASIEHLRELLAEVAEEVS